MNEQVAAAVRGFFDDALAASGGAIFDMGELYDYIQSLHQGTSLADLGKVMTELGQRGEVLWEPIEGGEGVGRLRALPPPNPYSAGAAASDASVKKKKSPFTKKQKQKALEELQALPALTPGLERLHEWLYEAVYS